MIYTQFQVYHVEQRDFSFIQFLPTGSRDEPEIFTPDSSRFWAAEDYRIGVSPKSYDKQFVRDWLIKNKLNGVIPAPELPEDITMKTAALYKDCYCKITGKDKY